MKIYKSFLISHYACKEAIEWYDTQKDKEIDVLFKALIEDEKDLNWLNWYLAHILKKIDKVKYAVFAARQVLHIFEDKYPKDNRPRKSIEAAEAYIKNPNSRNASAAVINVSASNASYAARGASYTVYSAANAAYSAARVAAYYAVCGAIYYETYTVYTTHTASFAGGRKVMMKILEYGIKLLKGESK